MQSNHFVDRLLEDLQDSVIYRTLTKGEEILQLGEVCDYVGIVRKGCLRMYYIDAEGDDVSFAFICLIIYLLTMKVC